MLLYFPKWIVYVSTMKKQKPGIPHYIKKLTHDSVPASVGLVKEMRNELCARFDTMDARFTGVDARFKGIDARFNNVDAQFKSIDSRFNDVDARIDRLDAKVDALDMSLNARMDGLDAKFTGMFSEVLVSVHRTQVLMEEQRSENRIVLDGIKNVLERMDRVEVEQREIKNVLRL